MSLKRKRSFFWLKLILLLPPLIFHALNRTYSPQLQPKYFNGSTKTFLFRKILLFRRISGWSHHKQWCIWQLLCSMRLKWLCTYAVQQCPKSAGYSLCPWKALLLKKILLRLFTYGYIFWGVLDGKIVVNKSLNNLSLSHQWLSYEGHL